MNSPILFTRTLRVNKPSKLRLSATLSALSSKMGVIPTKLVASLKDVLKQKQTRTYLDLTSYEDKTYKVELSKPTGPELIKQIYNNHKTDPLAIEKKLIQYAKESLHSSYAQTLEARIKELKGTLDSIIKSEHTVVVDESKSGKKKKK